MTRADRTRIEFRPRPHSLSGSGSRPPGLHSQARLPGPRPPQAPPGLPRALSGLRALPQGFMPRLQASGPRAPAGVQGSKPSRPGPQPQAPQAPGPRPHSPGLWPPGSIPSLPQAPGSRLCVSRLPGLQALGL
jgi:hypothetical protein